MGRGAPDTQGKGVLGALRRAPGGPNNRQKTDIAAPTAPPDPLSDLNGAYRTHRTLRGRPPGVKTE
ncbi:hypothetical protein GCM10010495_46590 [Kitasatospora herbaricolor]|nr:hypothetical protein GCM10010495_46590 [Kitasatospora herbaricolor]